MHREMNIQRCYSTEYQGMKVKYIDHMGNDLSVIRAATASFAKDPVEWDEKKHPRLINYLARGMTQAEFKELVESLEHIPSHISWVARKKFVADSLDQYRHTCTHWSPFTHTCITLQCTVPIAIHAQLVKHTVGFNINTVSRRYVSTTPELFIPEFRSKPTGNIKQGSGDVHEQAQYWQVWYKRHAEATIRAYVDMIDAGIAPEQARFVLPQGVMTEFVWTGNVASFARMFNQRTDSHSQKEIQDLAKMVGEIIEPLYPVAWNALTGN